MIIEFKYRCEDNGFVDLHMDLTDSDQERLIRLGATMEGSNIVLTQECVCKCGAGHTQTPGTLCYCCLKLVLEDDN